MLAILGFINLINRMNKTTNKGLLAYIDFTQNK